MAEPLTELEVCENARGLLSGSFQQAVKVTVFYEGGVLVGDLTKVSPVNAWIKVGGKQVPAGLVKRLEAAR